MLLKKLGYECLVANHGAHALQILEEQRVLGPEHEIEVILMDQSMDVMSVHTTLHRSDRCVAMALGDADSLGGSRSLALS